MKQKPLHKTLSDLVSGYGYEDVHKTLVRMRPQESNFLIQRGRIRGAATGKSPAKTAKKRVKPNAENVVMSLAITDSAKREILSTLAERYEAKEFMPSVNHVRDFLDDGKRDVTAIKSRQQVTTSVFKKLSELEVDQLKEILDRGLYGGPKRLAPFAQAIEGFDRQNRSA